MISVNLLPPEIKNDIAASKQNAGALKNLYTLLSIIFISALFFGGLYYYFQKELSTQKNIYNQKSQTVQKYSTVEESAKRVAEKIDTIKKISNDGSRWTGVIEEINKIVPAGITLNSIKIDTSNKIRGTITGYASSKNIVAAFRDAVDKSNKFQYVDIENSTTQQDPVTKREVESFTITFSLESGALK